MDENENKLIRQPETEDGHEAQEIGNLSEIKTTVKIPNYKRQFRGVCLIMFGILLSCYDWVDVGFYNFADFVPIISLLCGFVGVIVAFSDCIKSIKDFLNSLNE